MTRTRDREFDAFLAVKRFGFGARPGELETRFHDPQASLLAELEVPRSALVDEPGLTGRTDLLREHTEYREAVKAFRKTTKLKGADQAALMRDELGAPPVWESYRAEVTARVHQAARTRHPFLERLVAFWSNHLCIAADDASLVRLLAGQFERVVIRPNVLGRFEDMLIAAMRHPAMLVYLDNNRSVGPNSHAGKKSGNSLNENLAREILELHTLGVDGGYNQDDVTEFARALTGWSFQGKKEKKPGAFKFISRRHEPGKRVLLDQVYAQKGEGKALAMLRDVAGHPKTARFLSVKLVRHFLGSVPKTDLVDRLAAVYMATDGDLRALTLGLLEAPELWTEERAVLTSPYEFLVATLRASGVTLRGDQILKMLNVFGQPAWTPPSPAGWPDHADAWLAPDAIMERLDWAEKIATRTELPDDMSQFARDILGAAFDTSTQQAVKRAETRKQAFALLVMSTGFQRR